ncbi:hypothetical protein NHF46_10665 [Arthrobacter alpinus]|nr:hypothetical protein [Arthrobacter alpinus]
MFIALASALILVLAGAGIWWGVTAASSDTPTGVSGGSPVAGATVAALPARTHMGAIELRTAALAPMREFYVGAVGLEVLGESAEHLSLGNKGWSYCQSPVRTVLPPMPPRRPGCTIRRSSTPTNNPSLRHY